MCLYGNNWLELAVASPLDRHAYSRSPQLLSCICSLPASRQLGLQALSEQFSLDFLSPADPFWLQKG